MTSIIDFDGQAQRLLVNQFQNKPAIKALLEAFSEELQEVEVAFQQLKYLRLLEFAEGVQLDQLGDMLDQRREPGESDPDYKQDLYVAILRNTCGGDTNSVLNYIMALTGSTNVVYSMAPTLQTFFTTNGNFVPNLADKIRDVATMGLGTIHVHQPPDPPSFWETG